jgi:hypothetical protein
LGELFAFFAWTNSVYGVFVSIVATASYITIKMIEYIIQLFRE